MTNKNVINLFKNKLYLLRFFVLLFGAFFVVRGQVLILNYFTWNLALRFPIPSRYKLHQPYSQAYSIW